MRIVLAAMLFLASAEWSIVEQSNIQKLLSELNCKTIVLNHAHPQADLRGKDALWVLFNMGPASAVVRTKGDPKLNLVYKPYKGDKAPVFVGDIRYRYTIGLATPGSEAKVHACTVPESLKSKVQ